MKTAHQFARELLAGPDMQIVTPRVVQYSDAEECMEDPTAQVLDGEDAYDKPVQYVLLTYKPSQF